MANGIRDKKVDGIVRRNDGLENALSRKGVTGVSKTGSNRFNGRRLLTQQELRDIYTSGGIGAKVFTVIADAITSKGFTLSLGNIQSTGPGEVKQPETTAKEPTQKPNTDAVDPVQEYLNNTKQLKKLQKAFEKKEGAQAFNSAFTWARCYGGAAIVMQIDDGRGVDQPVDMENIKKLEKFHVYEGGVANNVQFGDDYGNPLEDRYGDTEYYMINTGFGTPIKVHESRVIILQGRKVDSDTRRRLQGWNSSELQPVYEELISLFSVMKSSEAVLDEMAIGTLKMENLDALCATDEGEEQIRKRLDILDTGKSNENTSVIGINEEYERHGVNLANMDKLQQNAMLMVSGASGIPATHLFGRSPQGENATGDSDEQMYNDLVATEQDLKYLPGLTRVFEVLTASQEVKVSVDMDEVTINFNPLGGNTLFDTARSFDHAANGWKSLVEAGIFSADDARNFIENGGMGLSFIQNVRT